MAPPFDLVCLSHLRWDFVYQRPQHLLTRAARDRRVFFVEEPILDTATPRLELSPREGALTIVVPHLPEGLSASTSEAMQALLLDQLFTEQRIAHFALWYYTPMALGFTSHLEPCAVAYDCMDELSQFRFAPPILREREEALLKRADVVFTGGHSLYEAKRDRHPNIHAFPSSVDTAHFARARAITDEPADQAGIPGPRLGFFGVIDERMDLALIDSVAALRPDWQIVMVGPVAKISDDDLPRRANIHYLGGKQYAELPAYLSGWDVAIMPFALNEATRFISPTKTPEYLAAGRPVVSTSIRDVVHPYQDLGLVRIADTPDDFVAAVEEALAQHGPDMVRRGDRLLSRMSWDRTWDAMHQLLISAATRPAIPAVLADAATAAGGM